MDGEGNLPSETAPQGHLPPGAHGDFHLIPAEPRCAPRLWIGSRRRRSSAQKDCSTPWSASTPPCPPTRVTCPPGGGQVRPKHHTAPPPHGPRGSPGRQAAGIVPTQGVPGAGRDIGPSLFPDLGPARCRARCRRPRTVGSQVRCPVFSFSRLCSGRIADLQESSNRSVLTASAARLH